MSKEVKVISIEELSQIKEGEIVPIQGFNGSGHVYVRLKRPSILSLASKGDIPNPLLKTAYNLFYGIEESTDKKANETSLKDNGKIFEIVAENALIEPTYKQLEEMGIPLNDVQILQIWRYVNEGATALESFRKLYEHTEDSKDEQEV